MDEIGGKNARMKNDNCFKLDCMEDILANILSRLPVMTLRTCKPVSKLYRRLICSSNFIDLQLRWSRKTPNYIVYVYEDLITNVYLMNGNGEISERITLPGSEIVPIGSINGLICCVNDSSNSDLTDWDIGICNPATREVFSLPTGKGRPPGEESSVGLAFCPRINEYKVFRFFHAALKSEDKYHECEIYSSITGSWRGIGSVANLSMGYHHTCVNGTVYWFVSSEEDDSIAGSILSVDMEENFQTICLPDDVTAHSFLVDLEGCLTLVTVYDDDEILNEWSLLDCKESSWIKKCSDSIPFPVLECVDSVAARKNELFFITSSHYLVYNLDDRTWRDLDLADTFGRNSPSAFAFTKSLLPCNSHVGGFLNRGQHFQWRNDNDK